MAGTDAVAQVADLVRLMKAEHPKSGAIMVERIAEGLRAGKTRAVSTAEPH